MPYFNLPITRCSFVRSRSFSGLSCKIVFLGELPVHLLRHFCRRSRPIFWPQGGSLCTDWRTDNAIGYKQQSMLEKQAIQSYAHLLKIFICKQTGGKILKVCNKQQRFCHFFNFKQSSRNYSTEKRCFKRPEKLCSKVA